MPHFWVDDGWHKHRKRIITGMDLEGFAARGLWLDAGSWCCDELTDGWVPAYMIDYLAPGIGRDLAKRLERGRLWEPETRDGEDGWQFHDWADFQLMRSEVLAQRKRKTDGGVLGNHRRWHAARGRLDPACRYCTTDRSTESVATPGRHPGDTEWPSAAKPPTNTDRIPDPITDRSTDRSTDQSSEQHHPKGANTRRTSDRSTESGPIPPLPLPIPTPLRAEDQTLFPVAVAPDEATPGSALAVVDSSGQSTKRATRLPERWVPSTALRAWAVEKLPGFDTRAEHDRFVDYWRGAPGAKGRKHDWDATWRNWMRTAAERSGRHSTNGHRPSTTDARVSAALDIATRFDQGVPDRDPR